MPPALDPRSFHDTLDLAGRCERTVRRLVRDLAVVARRAVDRVLEAQQLYEPPTTLPLLGNTLDVMVYHKHHLHDWFTEQCLAAGVGPWVLRIFGRPPTLILTSHTEIEDVFKTQFEVFERGPDMRALIDAFFGEGILAVDGDKWLQQRRTASHLFSTQMLRDVMDAVAIEKTLQLRDVLAGARQQKPVSMKSLLAKLSSDVFTKVGLGVDLNVEIMGVSLADKASAIDGSKMRRDLLTLFLETSDGAVDVTTVREVVVNFFLAGKDTTAFRLPWMLVNLNRYPEVLDKIRDEMKANLPTLPSGELEEPSMTDLQKLPYLEDTIVLTVLLSRFDIKTVQDPFEITYAFSAVIAVKGPLFATVSDYGGLSSCK
ncbi:hypothetical protein BBJ28_00009513 [Nothophytophthora sp. Chile5]|nr:hypothetical protein BBJ28_00009513 [Nothophytophthora sp. Chile5]